MADLKYIITLNKPCSENWDKMTAVEQGRYCVLCNKAVFDFSSMDKAQIIKILKKHKKHQLCGRFRTTQLDVAIEEHKSTNSTSPAIASFFLLIQCIGTVSFAQNMQPKICKVVPLMITQEKGIHGYIKDYITEQPLQDILVKIKSTDISTITDQNGFFFLQMPDTIHAGKVTISSSYAEKSGIIPSGTIIMDEEIDTLAFEKNSEILLYRYPINKNQDEHIIYSPPQPIEHYKIGGFSYEEVRASKKHRFWPFYRKKKKINE